MKEDIHIIWARGRFEGDKRDVRFMCVDFWPSLADKEGVKRLTVVGWIKTAVRLRLAVRKI